MEYHFEKKQEQRPRRMGGMGGMGGIDYGIDGKVLVRKNDGSLLIWSPGHSWYNNCFQPSVYSPTVVTINSGDSDYFGTTLFEGRVTKKKILEHAEKIDEVFGEGISELIDLKQTLVIDTAE